MTQGLSRSSLGRIRAILLLLAFCRIAFAQAPLPPAGASLPPKTGAVSARDLMRKLVMTQGEYESNEQFEARQEKLIPREGATFRFACTSSPFTITYDAENQEFSLAVPDSAGLELDRTAAPPRTYVGTNAFGVKKQIAVKSIKRCVVQTYPGKLFSDQVLFTIPCPAPKAPAMKKDLGFIIEVKTPANVWPVSEPETYHEEPTIDSPTDLTETVYTLSGIIQRVVIYRKSDRKILVNTALPE